MYSLSEIETTSKRASKAAGFSWGLAEEIGKATSSLELFGLQGVKNLNLYLNIIKERHPKKISKIKFIPAIKKTFLNSFKKTRLT